MHPRGRYLKFRVFTISADPYNAPSIKTLVSPEISVVIPLHNESPNVLPLVEKVFAALGNHPGGMEDGEVHGQQIRAGEKLALIFASGNRDEDVFQDPFSFQIDRNPNPHLTFGFGTHFCMGAHVGRVELETVLRHLMVRLDSFEVTGPISRLSSNVNGGIKHLPVRCRLT